MALTGGATLSTLDQILKDIYLPPVVEQLNNQVLLLQRLESTSEGLYGRKAIIPTHYGRTSGIGAAGEGQPLPTSGNQAFLDATYQLKSLYGRLQVTGQSMIQTRTDAGAFVQALNAEMDGLQNDLRKDLARQVYGDGSGIIALTIVNTATTTVTLASSEPILKGQLYVNMKVDLRDNTGAAIANGAGRTIASINPATPSITLDAAGGNVTTTTSTSVSRAGAISGANVFEIQGLKKLVPTAANTLGGIDATVNTWWDNQRATASGGNLSLDQMQQAVNTVQFQGGSVSAMYTTLGVQRKYFNLLQSQVRFNDPMTLKSGFSTLQFNNQPLIADVDAPFGFLYFCEEKHIKFFSPQDWQWMQEDGHILKWVVGYDAWEAAMARYLQLGMDRRNTQFVLSGITDATGV